MADVQHPLRASATVLVTRLVPLLACLATAPGCAAGDAGGGAPLDGAPRLALQEVLRLGSTDDPDYGFTNPTGVEVDAQGLIYVFDAATADFRVYEPGGRLVRRFGGRGAGPGEFRNAPRFGLLGDTLWAIESFGRRITLFRTDGTLVRTIPFTGVTVHLHDQLGVVMPVAMRADGGFTGDMVMFTGARGVELTVEEGDTVPIPLVVFDPSMETADTLSWTTRPPRQSGGTSRVTVGGIRYFVPRPPAPQPITETLADGRIVVEGPPPAAEGAAELRVTHLTLAGDTVFGRAYRYRPRPFDEAALAELAWRSARTPGGGIRMVDGVAMPDPVAEDSLAAFERIRDAMDFPPFQPPVQHVRTGADGSIWLMREEDGGTEQRWTVLDAAGELVGEVVLDRTVFPIRTGTEEVWVRERDDFDVPWLVRYRLTAG
jgi:hypothetical protein